ncbi:DUF5995 family protein [Chitinophaga ginsengisoli]|uniref:Uncharacterized protein n=1 Tax=Chitinophaga ginsengisoli TaxID=363837 RepID=A0A2P8FCW7_9BACT|nr:DUF5995 family protein [Chitinophaga ginsengisoli]PSL19573.1 hypothetical protein CLV42_12738 [Chitinophaga ginsengisoli]
MAAHTINEVIQQLEEIINSASDTGDRIGYFAALYHKVTVRVKEGISNNEFENGSRMEKLDVIFANRYLEAVTQYKNGQRPTGSWAIAFEGTKRSSVLVLQQLLLGMNAHINLDLGIAAVEVAGNQDIQLTRKDFNAINNILGSLTGEVITEINRISPFMSLLGLNANNDQSILIQFSITNARDGAWSFAEELYGKKGADYTACITARDTSIRKLAEGLLRPAGKLIQFTVWIIHLFEWKNPRRIIETLYKSKKTYIRVSVQPA